MWTLQVSSTLTIKNSEDSLAVIVLKAHDLAAAVLVDFVGVEGDETGLAQRSEDSVGQTLGGVLLSEAVAEAAVSAWRDLWGLAGHGVRELLGVDLRCTIDEMQCVDIGVAVDHTQPSTALLATAEW